MQHIIIEIKASLDSRQDAIDFRNKLSILVNQEAGSYEITVKSLEER